MIIQWICLGLFFVPFILVYIFFYFKICKDNKRTRHEILLGDLLKLHYPSLYEVVMIIDCDTGIILEVLNKQDKTKYPLNKIYHISAQYYNLKVYIRRSETLWMI